MIQWIAVAVCNNKLVVVCFFTSTSMVGFSGTPHTSHRWLAPAAIRKIRSPREKKNKSLIRLIRYIYIRSTPHPVTVTNEGL